jgi:hypothetical protein
LIFSPRRRHLHCGDLAELSDPQDLIPLDRTNFGLLDHQHGDRLTDCIEDFQGVACLLRRLTFMYLNDSGQIPLMKTVLREILCNPP